MFTHFQVGTPETRTLSLFAQVFHFYFYFFTCTFKPYTLIFKINLFIADKLFFLFFFTIIIHVYIECKSDRKWDFLVLCKGQNNKFK